MRRAARALAPGLWLWLAASPSTARADEMRDAIDAGKPFSAKAAAGFRERTRSSSLRFPPGFLDAVDAHIRRMSDARRRGRSVPAEAPRVSDPERPRHSLRTDAETSAALGRSDSKARPPSERCEASSTAWDSAFMSSTATFQGLRTSPTEAEDGRSSSMAVSGTATRDDDSETQPRPLGGQVRREPGTRPAGRTGATRSGIRGSDDLGVRSRTPAGPRTAPAPMLPVLDG